MGILVKFLFLLEFVFPNVSRRGGQRQILQHKLPSNQTMFCIIHIKKKKKKEEYLNLLFLVLKANRLLQVPTASQQALHEWIAFFIFLYVICLINRDLCYMPEMMKGV